MLEKKVTGSDSVMVEEARIVQTLPNQVGDEVRNLLPEMGAKEQDDSLNEEEVSIAKELQK